MLKKIAAVTITLLFIGFLLLGLSDFPPFGIAEESRVYNEVTDRYLEGSIPETGAINAVSAMILEYRAFDTFLEATVIFTALLLVILLLRGETGERKRHDHTDH
jgi:multicomponent Na+:H+ antiporter subunit B